MAYVGMEQLRATNLRSPHPGQHEANAHGPSYAGEIARCSSPARLLTPSTMAAAAALQGWARSRERSVVVLDPWGSLPTPGQPGEWSE